ncbi:hypothetical protein EMVG_00015 [Emiliania huxleyi virus PS401]|nr:hypothetical protein EMVG_00015 [Emiliania huxleyi virus PS401]
MAEKRLSVRFSSEGGELLKAEMRGIGVAGSEGLHKIDQSALEVEAQLAAMARSAGRSQVVLRDMGDARVGLQAVAAEQIKSARASAEVFEETDRLERKYNQLRASLDPTVAATLRYEQAQEDLADAVRRGVVTQEDADQTLAMARTRYLGAAEGITASRNAVNDLGRTARNRQNAVRNLALQLSQVGQQGAVTGNYLGALAIQLPDMAIGFGTLGIAIGAVSAVLAPMVVDWLRGADAGEDLEEVVNRLATAMGELDSATQASRSPIEDLLGDYGRFVGRAEEILAVQRQLAYLDATDALSSVTAQMAEMFGALDLNRQAMENAADWLQPLIERFDGLDPSSLAAIGDELEISEAAAIRLTHQFVALREARGPEAQAEALRNLIEQFELATGGVFNMSEESRELYRQLLNAEQSALRLSAIDMATNLSEGANQAERYGQALLDAITARNALAAGYVPNGVDEGAGAGRGRGPTEAELQTMRLGINFAPPPARGQAGGGGAGGGQTEQARAYLELQREAEGVFNRTRTALENYNTEQQRYQDLLDANLISTDTFDRAMEALNQQFAESQMPRLMEGIDGVSEALARAAVYGDDLREGLANVFQGIYFDIINSGIREALLDVFNVGGGGGGGILGGLFGGLFGGAGGPVKSFDGGGSTGMGARTGGLDGKGGFLAMLHPRETIIDHSRGQSSPGGQITIRIVAEEGEMFRPVIRAESRDVAVNVTQAGLSQYDSKLPERLAAYESDKRVRL